jgi:hypothetical protein
VHDVCAPISLTVQQPNDFQRAGIDGALELWRARGIQTVSVADGATAGTERGADALERGGVIELRFEAAAGPFHGLYDDETGIMYVNSGIEALIPLSIVIAHELGHSFGLPHVESDERTSLMNPGNLITPPNEADQAAIEALWGPCEEALLEPR